MNRFKTKDLMISVLPGGESTVACDGESTREVACDGESTREVACDGESTREAACDGESTREVACDGESTREAVGAAWSERDYELLHEQLDTALKG